MLLMIGPVRCEVAPFNVTGYSRTSEAGFVEKPVLGARPPLEYVGQGAQTWQISAKLFPHRFGGGSSLAALTALRASGLPTFIIRGDYTILGWAVVESVTETSSYLGRNGVGHVVEVEIALRSAPMPGLGAAVGTVLSMFRGG